MKTQNTIRKLTRVAKESLAIVIPPSIVRSFGWRERQRLIVKKVKAGVMIKDAKTKKSK